MSQSQDSVPSGPVWQSPERLTTRCGEALAEATRLRDAIKASDGASRTLDGTLVPFNRMLRAIDLASGWAGLMFSVHPEEAVRKAAQTCQEDIARFQNDVNLDRALFEAVAAVDLAPLSPQDKRFAEHLLRDFRRSGVDRDDATRERLAAIHEEMVRLGQDYQKNVRDDVSEIVVDDASELKGLPADYIAAHPPASDGKIHITTDYPDFFPVQTYAESSDLRRRLYIAYMQRAWPANTELLVKLLGLRAEYAGILGYPNWAAYNAEDKMARDTATIERFIAQVAELARPRAKKDLGVLLARKRKDLPKAKAIEVWDRFYYVGKVREATYDFDARDVRPYFSYPRVREGILALYAELFGLRFELDETAEVWHPSVRAYRVWSGDEELGLFYLDMHPREGKYKHAAMFPIQTGLEGGPMAMATLVCNFPDPATGDGRALMEHSDVVTFFHEFGHLIHHLLAQKSRWVTLAGINVEWDFVEAPSQILEEWSWEPTVLQRFARHIDTDEPIPAEMVARMRGAEEFGKGVAVMRQVFYAAYSYFLHIQDPKTLDIEAFTDKLYGEYNPYPRLDEAKVYANFGHLIGYSSMYYTYQWSLVIAKDLFTRFQTAGLLDREVARAYREAILEPGGSVDASDLVVPFLGRPFGLDAYREWLQRD
ncbi:MAG: Zn-dependent oligopeptidase [Deltaproteobacteria bacterium]|nr:Zn-dependent oligopeptidase [Deltaproteobacteria bacterium]